MLPYVLLLSFHLAVPGPDSLRVTFIGNAAVEITDGEWTLVSDFPYRSGAFGYMEYDTAAVRPSGPVLALITHGHDDHFDRARFAGLGWALVGPPSVTAGLDGVVPLDAGRAVFGPVHVQAFPTPHGDVPHFSYLVEWHGARFFFSGDTGDPGPLVAATELDVAFVTPWLGAELRALDAHVDARRIVVYHHRNGESVACDGCVVPRQRYTLRIPVR